MAFHTFSMEDTSCEQAWGQAAPAQPQLPHCLHGGEEDNLSLAFIPNLCCHLERLGKGSEEALVQQGTGFGAVLGWCSPPGFSWVSILLKRCQWRSFSPLCDPQSLGCISTAASAHGLPCCAPWAAWPTAPGTLGGAVGPLCLCASSNPACSCTSHVFLSQNLEAQIFFLGRCHEQLPEPGSDHALMTVHMGSRVSRKKHHPWRKQ